MSQFKQVTLPKAELYAHEVHPEEQVSQIPLLTVVPDGHEDTHDPANK